MKHKGLRRLFEDGKTAGLPARLVDKIRNILVFLQDMETSEELQSTPSWKVHQLSGDCTGTWSLAYRKTGASYSGSIKPK